MEQARGTAPTFWFFFFNYIPASYINISCQGSNRKENTKCKHALFSLVNIDGVLLKKEDGCSVKDLCRQEMIGGRHQPSLRRWKGSDEIILIEYPRIHQISICGNRTKT